MDRSPIYIHMYMLMCFSGIGKAVVRLPELPLGNTAVGVPELPLCTLDSEGCLAIRHDSTLRVCFTINVWESSKTRGPLKVLLGSL